MAEVSACCGSQMRVAGRTTNYYVCVACERPCDATTRPERAVTTAARPDAGAQSGAPASGPRVFVIDIPPGTPIVGGNNRQDRWSKNARVHELKEAAAVLARKQRIPPLGQCDITVAYESPPRLKAKRHPLASDCITDSDNIAPTGKALVDGLVQAGLWASDGRKRVRSVRYELSPQTHPRGRLVLTITELPAGDGR